MIVVIILGILAGVVIPALGGHIQEVKETSLETSCEVIRKAVEIYAADHGGTYPGYREGNLSENPTETWFLNQMFLKTDRQGHIDPDGECGPYLRSEQGFPRNPLNNQTKIKVEEVDSRMPELSGQYGWTFNAATGKFNGVTGEEPDTQGESEIPEL